MASLKSLGKRILTSERVRLAACWLGAQYIRLVWATCRWEEHGRAHMDDYVRTGKPGILCFWHGRLLMMPYVWRGPQTVHMLISGHRDGELIANTVKHFGIAWIKGSSSKDGAQALRAMLRTLKTGDYVGITPDGPRGPRMRASDGIVTVARLSGAAVLPMAFGIRRGKVLGSWDRFLIPFPFSKGVAVLGRPITVARDADAAALARARQEIENALNAITAEADRLCDRRPVEPDARPAGIEP